LAKKIDSSLSEDLISNSDSFLENAPDIESRYVINNVVKKFLEIFASGEI
jgi:hypothetical protein